MFIREISEKIADRREVSVAILVIFLLFTFTTPVNAGLFSKIGKLFGATETDLVYVRDEYSGLMDGLLSPALSIDPKEAQGGSEITVDDDALFAVNGPLGSSASGDFIRPDADQIYLYKVRPGDTLSGIAERFGVETNTIRWANDISHNDVIRVDQVLTILPVSGVRHTITKGDTLATIAKKYSSDAKEIANYNSLDPDRALVVGNTITVPGGEIETPKPVISKKRDINTKGVGGVAKSSSGKYIAPVSGCILTQGIHSRNAVDIGCPKGTPIYAPYSGTVLIARTGGWNGGYGVYEVVNFDDGTQGVFAHQQRLAVGAGERVVQGQIIGYVGTTGNSTGYHLHFEHRGGPLNYMAR